MEKYEVTTEQYDNGLGCLGKKVSILYKQKPYEINVSLNETYKTGIKVALW